MKRVYSILFPLCALLFFAAGCSSSESDDGGNGNGNGGGGNSDEEYVAPEPPETIDANNLFNIDFFSALDDAPFFTMRDISVASAHINEQTGKRSAIYLFDRTDCTPGEANPAVKIAYNTKSNALFAQNTPTGTQIEGTGIITRYEVTRFDGVAIPGRLFLSGCGFTLVLAMTNDVCIYTTKIDALSQVEAMLELRSSELLSNGIVVGTVKNEIKTSMSDFLKRNHTAYRLEFHESPSTPYSLFVLTPVNYVCRSIEPLQRVNLPYYCISIEKIS